jgi:hypothetical protein
MTSVVIGGAMFAGLILLAGKGKNSSDSETEYYYKLGKIEQAMQQTKEKVLYQML